MLNKKPSQHSSDFIGVYYATDRRKWRAEICVQGKRKNLGTYESEPSAALAYLQAKRELLASQGMLDAGNLQVLERQVNTLALSVINKWQSIKRMRRLALEKSKQGVLFVLLLIHHAILGGLIHG